MKKKRINVMLILRVLLGGIFIFSAVAKLLSLGIFEIGLIDMGVVDSRIAAGYLSRALIAFELFLGLSYFQPFGLKRIILPVTFCTLSAFTTFLVFTKLTGSDMANCRCFGELINITPIGSIVKNIFLIGITLFLFFKGHFPDKRNTIPLIIGICCFTIVFLLFPVRNLKNFIFARYTKFNNGRIVDFSTGEYLVGVMSLNCKICQETAARLKDIKNKSKNLPEIYFLFLGDTEEVRPFRKKTGAYYDYRFISPRDFFSLIGKTPPRIYWLKDGRVEKYWDSGFSKNDISG